MTKKAKIILGKPVCEKTLVEELRNIPEIYPVVERRFIEYEISVDEFSRERTYNSLREHFIGRDFEVFSEFDGVHRFIYWTHNA